MSSEKTMLSGNTAMLVLSLLEAKDMYGYQIIEELSKKSEDVFCVKTGTLYPILHDLENSGMLVSYDENADNRRMRKYYKITKQGKVLLAEKKAEWDGYTKAVNQVLDGGVGYAFA